VKGARQKINRITVETCKKKIINATRGKDQVLAAEITKYYEGRVKVRETSGSYSSGFFKLYSRKGESSKWEKCNKRGGIQVIRAQGSRSSPTFNEKQTGRTEKGRARRSCSPKP